MGEFSYLRERINKNNTNNTIKKTLPSHLLSIHPNKKGEKCLNCETPTWVLVIRVFVETLKAYFPIEVFQVSTVSASK